MGGKASLPVLLPGVFLGSRRSPDWSAMVETSACDIGDTGILYIPDDTLSHLQHPFHLLKNHKEPYVCA